MPNILMTGTGPVEAPGIPTNGWLAVNGKRTTYKVNYEFIWVFSKKEYRMKS